jgi:adenine deaminase
MHWPGIVGLGEMMNYPGVVAGDPKMLAEIAVTQAAGKTVGGHYASPDLTDFPAYAAGGPADDHEGTREEDAIMRVRQGMRAMLRLGSAWYDVKAQITAVTEKGLDPRSFILCTDDCHSGTLVHDGHMNRVVRHAIECGLDPLVAIQMATINTATHFGLERELGSIAPGRRADLILTSDLRALPVETVIARGRVAAEGGRCLADLPGFDWPESARRTVRLGRTLDRRETSTSPPRRAPPASGPASSASSRTRHRRERWRPTLPSAVASSRWTVTRMSPRSPSSSATAAPAASRTASSRASAIRPTARWPPPSPTTATT